MSYPVGGEDALKIINHAKSSVYYPSALQIFMASTQKEAIESSLSH